MAAAQVRIGDDFEWAPNPGFGDLLAPLAPEPPVTPLAPLAPLAPEQRGRWPWPRRGTGSVALPLCTTTHPLYTIIHMH